MAECQDWLSWMASRQVAGGHERGPKCQGAWVDLVTQIGGVMARKSAVKEAMTKSAIFSEISESTGLTKKDVKAVFDELDGIIERHIMKRAVGQFTLPGLLKIKTVKKPARKARKNVPNPFKPGELMDVAAKPATTRIKVLPLKKLKDMPL